MRDDDDGQVDGDGPLRASPFATARSPFALARGDQPWLRQGTPPWHMWGNSQLISTTLSSGIFSEGISGQLAKIAYGRPETWHFILSARFVSGTAAPLGTLLDLNIVFELTVGIGRSIFQTFQFDSFRFRWENANAPTNVVLWTTQVNAPAMFQNVAVPLPADVRPVTQIVAQDIQLNFRAALLLAGAAVGYPYTASAEVSAFFAPKTHVRPDWQRKGPEEMQFPGAEVAGK